MKRKDAATFVVKIQHRQNASWQGQVTWVDEQKSSHYRSIWELIRLMESALPEGEEPEWEAPDTRRD